VRLKLEMVRFICAHQEKKKLFSFHCKMANDLPKSGRMSASFLQNLPTSGLLAQISEKIVQRVVSLPRSWSSRTFLFHHYFLLKCVLRDDSPHAGTSRPETRQREKATKSCRLTRPTFLYGQFPVVSTSQLHTFFVAPQTIILRLVSSLSQS
jgi:hypothetical protein